MSTDLFFSLACAALLASLFGLALTFAGYRFFRILLPIWGFFFGLWLGAQSIQVLFNVGFLATVTSWVVGFIVGLIFAALSYPFYLFAVAVIAGSLGYYLAVGILLWLGMPLGFLMWLIGVIVGAVLIVVTLVFNIQKWVIMIATSVLGAGIIAATFTFLFNPHAIFLENPVKVMLQTSPLLLIMFLFLVLFGIIVQARAGRPAMVSEPAAAAKPMASTGQAGMGTTPAAPAAPMAGAAPAGAPVAAAAPMAGAAAVAAGVVAAAEKPQEPVATMPATPEMKPMQAQSMEPAVEMTSPEEAEKFKYNLEYIEGIGPVYAGKLKAIGITNPKELLERGAFPKGREEIATAAGISSALVLTWVNHVDLFRIKGVGSEYADLLERAGVDTVVELANRNPDNLFAKLVSINEEKKLVRKLPVLSQVQEWVEQAKSLPRMINY